MSLIVAVVVVLASALTWVALTLRAEFADSNGAPPMVVVATWMRNNNMSTLTAQLEDVYYTYVDKPKVGGVPTISADIGEGQGLQSASPSPSARSGTAASSAPSPAAPTHLEPPATIVSPVTPAEPKEGVWQPVGTLVDGVPAVYVTRVRADNVHTSYYASLMWIDTMLAKAMFVPGYEEPGGPNPYDGALPQQYWPDVLANVNGAFRLDDSQGGYYYQGTMVRPLVDGRASAVIYKDGTVTIGKWGRDVSMTPEVDVVRQNLNLIVDGGKSKVSSPSDNVVWGATTDKESLAWRAAMGQRADGSLVYVGSPYLSAQGLADTLVAAGVQKAIVLDMNNWWTAGFYFEHDAEGTPVCHKLDPAIQEGCDRFLKPYKRDSFQFLAAPSAMPMSATPTSGAAAPSASPTPSATSQPLLLAP
jgi:hypothetical protein